MATKSTIEPIRGNAARTMLLFATVCLGLVSCKEDEEFSRKEQIEVFTISDGENINSAVSTLDANTGSVYVRANVNYGYEFQTDDPGHNWLTILGKEYDASVGADKLKVSWTALDDSYKERSGYINITSPGNNIGKFLRVRQGLKTIAEDDFEWLGYGSANPYDNAGDRGYDAWTQEQKDKKWDSTLETPKIYGKMGYIRLGDDQQYTDLLTPPLSSITSDSILMVRFNALAHQEADGTKDNNKFTVRILNGGVFTDGSTETVITLSYIDKGARYNRGASIWDTEGGNHILYIKDGRGNHRTQNTRVQFIPDDAVPSRVYFDDFFIHALDKFSYYLTEED